MPHNQIGTLKQSQSELCESCYHYIRWYVNWLLCISFENFSIVSFNFFTVYVQIIKYFLIVNNNFLLKIIIIELFRILIILRHSNVVADLNTIFILYNNYYCLFILYFKFCFFFFSSIMAPSPFEGAEENVKRVLEKHNTMIMELQKTCLKNNTL